MLARVAVVDGEPLFRMGALSALAGSGLFEAVAVDHLGPGGPGTGVAALDPAAVVLDASLGARPYAADIVAELLSRSSRLAVVVTVGRARPAGLVEVIELGARALIDRQCSPDELVAAVAAAVRGQNWVAAPLAALLRRELAAEASGQAPPELSGREQEVLRLLAHGGTNAEIGRRLGISEHTVRNHVHSIMRKLDVGTRTDVVATAVRRGLVDIPY